MPISDLPGSVRTLISHHIESVRELEVLLAMRSATGSVDCAALARELKFNEPACAEALDKLATAGLLATDAGAYRFSPESGSIRDSVDALADNYARRRVSVVRFIYKGD